MALDRIKGEETVFGSCPCIMYTCHPSKPVLCLKYTQMCLICDGKCCCAGGESYPVGCLDEESYIAKKKLSLYCMEGGFVMPNPKQLCFCDCSCLICTYKCDCCSGKGPCAILFYQISPEKGFAMVAPKDDVMQRV
jgi:hypothetical protein